MHRHTFLLLLLSLVTTIACFAQINVADSFETPGLSPIWARDRMEPGSVVMQRAVIRNGHSAARVTLHTGDTFEAGQDKSHDSERDELREADQLFSREDKKYEFRFSFFLPDSFPIVPTRLVIAQWKQACHHNPLCSDGSPVLAIRYRGGKLFITLETDTTERVNLYETKEDIRNRWLDFRFQICFSRGPAGLIDAWLNNRPIVHFTGITCYPERMGYTAPSQFYFKMGLYRDVMPQPMTMYIDDYSKKEL